MKEISTPRSTEFIQSYCEGPGLRRTQNDPSSRHYDEAGKIVSPSLPQGTLDDRSQLLPSDLEKLEKMVSCCVKCKLCEGRTQTVFGVGNIKSELMFVGEAPGRDEDIRGEPFVGRAGQLLTKIIAAMGYQRHDVYIANVVKCRPPNNRGPFPQEVESCMPYLLKQIELIKPHILVGLGSYAVKSLLNSEEPISKLRGRFFDFHGIKLMATFHPAYLLRNPNMKKFVWEDMQKVIVYLKESKERKK
ncbi:MAG: uracil-DNA glycosylase [Deltaproteobacteria bacterium]|nr:uracil-DNA glycosylase [Deltaproteobacteria bacterium]